MPRSETASDSEPRRDPVDALIGQWRSTRPDLTDHLPAMALFSRLGRLAAHTTASIEAALGEHGLTIADFDVLAALRRSGEPFELKPIGIARSLMLSPSGITGRLDRLESSALVTRHMDPDDRRSFLVRLTRRGRTVVDAAVTDHVANEARLLEPLTAKERSTLDEALRRLLAQFDEA